MIYLKKNIRQDVGATAIEYGLLSALIAITTIVALQSTGTNLGTTYCTIANELSQAVGAGSTASGCSAPSSSSSSSSSADSSGSSADSSGSSADSSSSGSSDSSASSDSSSPAGAVYDASNSYSVSLANLQDELRTISIDINGHGGYNTPVSITGLYGDNGDAINSFDDLKSYFGLTDQQWADGLSDGNFSPTDVARWGIMSNAITNSGKNLYIPDPTKLTFTNPIGKSSYGYLSSANGKFYVQTTDRTGSTIVSVTAPTGN